MIYREQIIEEHEPNLSSLKTSIALLRKSIEETQKYELLTTNQYLIQMELIIEILANLTSQENRHISNHSRRNIFVDLLK